MNADRRSVAHASLRFVGEDLDPDVVTSELRLNPTLSYRKGEPYISGRSRREYIGRTGVWLLDTKSSVDSDDLITHLSFLSGLLTKRVDRLDRVGGLVRERGFEADASCFWYGTRDAAEPNVPASFRSLIARLNGEVWVEFHREGESEHAQARRVAVG